MSDREVAEKIIYDTALELGCELSNRLIKKLSTNFESARTTAKQELARKFVDVVNEAEANPPKYDNGMQEHGWNDATIYIIEALEAVAREEGIEIE